MSRQVKVFCVVDPENNILFETVRDNAKQTLHEFDMLQPVSWLLAKLQGFRLVEFEMIEKCLKQ